MYYEMKFEAPFCVCFVVVVIVIVIVIKRCNGRPVVIPAMFLIHYVAIINTVKKTVNVCFRKWPLICYNASKTFASAISFFLNSQTPL